MFRLIMVGLVSLLLHGCGGASEEKPKGVIPQYQLDAMQKAEDLENKLQEAEQNRREEMNGSS